MATQKEYSCVKKTKKAFEMSLVSIAKEVPLNKISVKQICERAELSRNAFYFHYSDINALIQDIEDNMINEITAMFGEFREIGYPDNILTIIQNLTDYLIGRRETTLMLLDSTYSTSFTKRFNAAFSNFFFEYFKQYHKTESRGTYDCFYNYVSSGYCGMLSNWLHDPGDISRRHFIRLAYTFAGRMLITDKSQNIFSGKHE
ncbi:MAG: TetR/AcrR family transcriptional regulator C-terminal domain-containing protein [Faecalibacterium sp.]|nr:TetR/AcrR family transcriptional regulator C-terminal domain-containing protein [Ruminococcus sp.]MCM1392694.1 TetR/AcrR family transcriptional regulator C-terminal domain-containing protein [Ruminococcus sp.]MCM1486379.1 TetR/AcrR family transcriptional regulator C-terminal domain-containing protein [Faecalibacterium sp.]